MAYKNNWATGELIDATAFQELVNSAVYSFASLSAISQISHQQLMDRLLLLKILSLIIDMTLTQLLGLLYSVEQISQLSRSQQHQTLV